MGYIILLCSKPFVLLRFLISSNFGLDLNYFLLLILFSKPTFLQFINLLKWTILKAEQTTKFQSKHKWKLVEFGFGFFFYEKLSDD